MCGPSDWYYLSCSVQILCVVYLDLLITPLYTELSLGNKCHLCN